MDFAQWYVSEGFYYNVLLVVVLNRSPCKHEKQLF